MAKITPISPERGPEHRGLHLREIFADADAPLETVGQDLREARQRKGENLATVSAALKIRKDYLDALEESNFDALPGRAYALGFIRSYADYLGLDSKQCVARFKSETAGRWGQEDSKLNLSDEEERKFPPGLIVLAVLLVLAMAYGAYYLTVAASHMFSQSDTTVPARFAAEAVAAAPAPAPAPVIEPATAEPPNLPEGQTYGEKNVDSRVTLRVYAAARVLVQGPGNAVYLNRTLAPGDSYRTPNIPGVILTTPDSGAIEIIVDGMPLGFLGAKGAIAEGLSLNAQDLIGHYPKQAG